MSKSLEDRVKKELGIKWVAAKQLIQQALDGLGDEVSDEDEIFDEVCDIFEDLPPEEQEDMKLKKNIASDEPDWKRKAREQAERREREFEERMANEAQKAEETTAGDIDAREPATVTTITTPPRRKVKTEVTKIKYVDGKAIKEVVIEEREVGEPTKVTTYTCCVIL